MKHLLIYASIVSMLILGCGQPEPVFSVSDDVHAVIVSKKNIDTTLREPDIKYRVLASGYATELERQLNEVVMEITQLDFWYISDVTYQCSNGWFSAMITIKRRNLP